MSLNRGEQGDSAYRGEGFAIRVRGGAMLKPLPSPIGLLSTVPVGDPPTAFEVP